VPDRNSRHGNAGLRALLDDLVFEGFRVGLTLAHGDPDVKGNCVRLKIRGHNHPYWQGSEGVFTGPLPYIVTVRATHLPDTVA
jgi:metallophosphoesterase superfamily enzyme